MHVTDPGARRIRQLPPLVVNQIAAGEVVERPASVVKELVENALDAGARRIVVELERGGVELVRVSDDGGGIAPEDLPLALAAHATSKIDSAEDLERVSTMGFRGEALASIASVARVSIRSCERTPGSVAHAIEAEGDRIGPVTPAAAGPGTVVTVRNLFFNTPARRRFLRAPTTEQGRCVDAVRDLAMAHPGVGFRVTCDGRPALDLAPVPSARERALAILGAELAEQLVEVHGEGGGAPGAPSIVVWGLAGRPVIARATAQAQHVFINGRCIRDRAIQHALKEAYRGLVEPGRHPTAVLMVEMDPAGVDVNVHPAKSEVRFRDPSIVHATVYRSVREALVGADLAPTIGAPRPGAAPAEARAIPWAGGSREASAGPPGLSEPRVVGSVYSFEALRRAVEAGRPEQGHDPSSPPSVGGPELAPPRPVQRVLQVHNSFLVTQDEDGVVIIDQHALHERVMFERLVERQRAGGGRLESQRLLAPAMVPVSRRQAERLDDLGSLMARIGLEARLAGPELVAVDAFPTMLFDRGVEPGPFVAALLERAAEDGFAPGSEEALHEVLDMMACKAAVKAGDALSEGELLDLLRMREAVERSSNCPHGRPTTIRLSIRALEKLFQRT